MRRPARSALRQPVRIRPGHASTPARPTQATTSGPSASPHEANVPLASLLQAAVGQHQAGNHAEAERLYRQVLARDPAQPDALHLLGVLAYQVGRADTAVPLIQRAIENRPSAPIFHLNLGNALLALGQVDDAVVSYRQAAVLAPTDPDARYNLGNALIQHGDAEAGIAELQQAVRLRPDHVGAPYNLGNALREAGQLEDAMAAYSAVVRRQPDFVDAQTNLGTTLHALGRHDEAQVCFERVLAARPDDPAALVNLAEALREAGQLDAAATRYDRALSLVPDDATALRGLASIWQTRGRSAEAADLLGRLVAVTPDDAVAREHYARALIAAALPEMALKSIISGLERTPDDSGLRTELVGLLQTLAVADESPVVRAALLAICADDTFDPQRLATPIARIMMAEPAFQALLAAVLDGLDPLTAGIPLPATLLSEPVVLAALPRIVFCVPSLELVLTALRRATLLRSTLTGDALPLPRPFLCALAGAAFLTEHTWQIEDDEAERLDAVKAALRELLADPDADPAAAEDLLLLAALYGRLGRLPGAERLASVPGERWSPAFVGVVREQVLEPIEERALAERLPAVTTIQDLTSQAVQAMYEENPYPRWRAARFHGAEPLIDRFRILCPDEPEPDWPARLPVLVAGAGTGQHPIQTALRLRDADVLAVDLSRPSLAYGARMAARLAVPNLRFAHGDILALDVLEERFALIECAGVLHHLADPLAGWSVLRRLLRPDGLMLIALYSERARARVVAARELIATEGLRSTAEGIRAARRRFFELPPEHPAASLVKFWDFYSESGFRDLAMHVQEHRFTVQQLATSLDALDLRFLGFELGPTVMARFRERFPAPEAHLDLECWDRFEAEHPDTFSAMYQLWCRPR